MPTKLEEEFNSFKESAKNFGGILSMGYNSNPAPIWLVKLLDDIITSEATVWFCAGIAIEAAGITIQMLMRVDSYPIADALVASAIAAGLYYYQKKRKG